ncbi:hypothetical protein Hypma_008665 [Hypsizygus marmoreus]|uniref:Uncharacterized protein n=1 Tax=Hypsizygus marmoreus TaxID=39966 RepID=A0A369JSD2_HYPMA|nr:hypothetical protein Hypma_008665 [Hypsizygus marmoreus]
MDALSTLLAPLASDAKTSRHCVRCHQEYSENTNDNQACKIKHGMSDADGDLHSDYSDTCMITLYCCGKQHLKDEMPTEWCIVASHTTNPEDVMYYDEEEDERDDRGNERVVNCEEFGCMKKRKKPATSSKDKPPAKKIK